MQNNPTVSDVLSLTFNFQHPEASDCQNSLWQSSFYGAHLVPATTSNALKGDVGDIKSSYVMKTKGKEAVE